MNVLLDTAAWINGVKEPETLPARALSILRNEANRFFLSDISLLSVFLKPRCSDVRVKWILEWNSLNGSKKHWPKTYRSCQFPPGRSNRERLATDIPWRSCGPNHCRHRYRTPTNTPHARFQHRIQSRLPDHSLQMAKGPHRFALKSANDLHLSQRQRITAFGGSTSCDTPGCGIGTLAFGECLVIGAVSAE